MIFCVVDFTFLVHATGKTMMGELAVDKHVKYFASVEKVRVLKIQHPRDSLFDLCLHYNLTLRIFLACYVTKERG